MRRFVRCALSLLLSVVTSTALDATPSQSSAMTPEELLARAAALIDITHSGAPGIMLLAKVRLQDGDKSTEGQYALAWADRHFRRVYRFSNYLETDVQADDLIFRQRSTEALPLLIWELDRLLNLRSFLQPQKETKVSPIKDSGNRNCIIMKRSWAESKICLDSSTGLLQSVDEGLDAYTLSTLHERFEFSNYQPFEKVMFPRKLSFRGWGSRLVDVTIEKLLKAETFPADEFTAPRGAERKHYCENPEITGELRPSTGNAIPIGLDQTEVDMFFQVSPQGGVRYAQVVYSTNPLKNKEILNWFIGTHFPIQTCAGEPVSYETVVRLVSGH